jgi:hypothetical protein
MHFLGAKVAIRAFQIVLLRRFCVQLYNKIDAVAPIVEQFKMQRLLPLLEIKVNGLCFKNTLFNITRSATSYYWFRVLLNMLSYSRNELAVSAKYKVFL